MPGDAEQTLACTSNMAEMAVVTGKMLRRALVARPAPDGFRKSLLRNLVEGRFDAAAIDRSRVSRSHASVDRPSQLG